jgi:hypothetical protein
MQLFAMGVRSRADERNGRDAKEFNVGNIEPPREMPIVSFFGVETVRAHVWTCCSSYRILPQISYLATSPNSAPLVTLRMLPDIHELSAGLQRDHCQVLRSHQALGSLLAKRGQCHRHPAAVHHRRRAMEDPVQAHGQSHCADLDTSVGP